MTTRRWILAIVAIPALVLGAGGIWADEGRSAATQLALPAAVKAAVEKAYPKAEIEGVKVEDEYGLRVFDVELGDGQAEIELSLAEDGTIIEVAAEATAKDLPKAVADAVAKEVPGADVREVKKEEVQAEPKLEKLDTPKATYKAVVAKEGKEAKIRLGADGTVLREVEWRKAEVSEAKTPATAPAAKVELNAKAAEAVKKAFPTAMVAKVKLENADDQAIYEIELTQDGKSLEIAVTDAGLLVEVEAVVAADSLPKVVADALAKTAPGAEIKKCQKRELHASAKLAKLATARIKYEVEVVKDGKKAKMEVAVDGAVIKKPMWKEAGDEDEDENREHGHQD